MLLYKGAEEIMAENFPELMIDAKPQIQAQNTQKDKHPNHTRKKKKSPSREFHRQILSNI